MKTTTLKMAIAVAAFLCFLLPNMAKAQSFPAIYNVTNNIACNVTFDIYFIDASGSVCNSYTGQTATPSSVNPYSWGSCGSRKDVKINNIGGIDVTKLNLGPNTSVSTCGGSTYTIDWGYGGVDVH